MITVYGIPNCDTVKKARAWLSERGVEHTFHDFKKQGLPERLLDHWLTAVGWELLLNKKGTTWRKLDAGAQAAADNPAGARALMIQQPSIIKRPVVAWDVGAKGAITVGFDASIWVNNAGRV